MLTECPLYWFEYIDLSYIHGYKKDKRQWKRKVPTSVLKEVALTIKDLSPEKQDEIREGWTKRIESIHPIKEK